MSTEESREALRAEDLDEPEQKGTFESEAGPAAQQFARVPRFRDSYLQKHQAEAQPIANCVNRPGPLPPLSYLSRIRPMPAYMHRKEWPPEMSSSRPLCD